MHKTIVEKSFLYDKVILLSFPGESYGRKMRRKKGQLPFGEAVFKSKALGINFNCVT